jgi:hypothetical protein
MATSECPAQNPDADSQRTDEQTRVHGYAVEIVIFSLTISLTVFALKAGNH